MILMDVGLRGLWRTVEDEVVVEEGEDHAPDPGLGLDHVQGTAKGQDPDPSRALDLAPDPREEASLAPGQEKSPARGPDPAPSLVTRREIRNPVLVLNPSQRRDPSLAPALARDQSLVPDPTALSLAPGPDPGPSLLQKMEINPHTQTNPDHAQSLRRKWKRMVETLFPLTTVTTKSISSLAVLIKINVFFSSLSKCRRYPSYFFQRK